MPQQGNRYSKAELIRAYQRVFGSEDGQMVMLDMLQRFAHNRQPMYQPGDSAQDLVFREGQRSVLVHVGNMFELDADRVEADEQTEAL